MSIFYNFLKNMWIMRKADEEYLQARVVKNQINQVEYEEIVAIEQVPEQ
ncbi:TPA: hypothetical protein JRS25_003671 [Escherichia coli]|nr:hypothetical protein [Escherichia coli]